MTSPKHATARERTVAKVLDTTAGPGMGAGHTVRPVLEPGHWEEYDPFLALMEDWFVPGIFGPHPHRGFETVTFVLEGEIAHRDNHGGVGLLKAGDAQMMTAGRGIVRDENPASDSAHSLQLWLNLPATLKMTEPRYQDLRADAMPVRREPGALVRVYSGRSGDAVSSTLNHVPLTMFDIHLDPGTSFAHELPGGDSAFLYVLEGSVRIGADQSVAKASQVVWFSRAGEAEGSTVTISADGPARAVFFSAPPLREPVAARGPMVMNTPQELDQAFADFRHGKF